MKLSASPHKTLRLFIVFALTLFSVQYAYTQQLNLSNNYNLQQIQAKSKALDSSKINVVIFYAPQCPICINLTKAVSTIAEAYGTQVNFTLIYPGTYYSNRTIRKFQKKYKLKIAACRDADKQLVNALQATVTPQAFVINQQGKVVYNGKIDNQYEAIGKRRTVVTEYYLRNAIDSALKNEEPAVKSTEAVGCFIE